MAQLWHLSIDQTDFMIRNVAIVACRALLRNPGYSFINIAGLAVGMAVSMFIGLWAYDELTFNSYHSRYDHIAAVYQNQTANQEINTSLACPLPFVEELKTNYKSDFIRVVTMWWEAEHTILIGDKKLSVNGSFMDPEGLEMFSFRMLKGNMKSLDDPANVVISSSTAKSLFGNEDPVNKQLRVDSQFDLRIAGVYEDIPLNSRFHHLQFVGSWKYWIDHNAWLKKFENDWSYQIPVFVELVYNSKIETLSAKIRDAKLRHITPQQANSENPQLFLEPMSRWHLHSEWKDGKSDGGRTQFVQLFSTIGVFVLLLACINFMNLSTAQSERRAREVGIRKVIGSARWQLMNQFLAESLLLSALAFLIALVIITSLLPAFNLLTAKTLQWPLANGWFWLAGITFVLITGILAGSYPAIYLSSFQPVKVLKGKFHVGKLASLPRKVLVVIQFTVSITLIIGTIIVWQEVDYAKQRPIGYSREGLIMIRKNSEEFFTKTDVLAHELMATGAVTNLAEASNPATEAWFSNKGFNWNHKDPNLEEEFVTMAVTHDYGRTVGWTFIKGRDFSRMYSLDSTAMVLNETAAAYMKLNDPVNEEITWNGKRYHVIGVIKDMIIGSPFEPVKQTIFTLDYNQSYVIMARLNPDLGAAVSLDRIAKVFQKLMPAVPFVYKFADKEFAAKFAMEERAGWLATLFAALAIFISCLGLFGMSSFVAEQRRKEIGIRKVLGASVNDLWKMLSMEFLQLVTIACFLGIPIAWQYLDNWLHQYSYRIDISPWVFVVTSAGALLITLITVSFQTLRSSMSNPVKAIQE